MVYGRGSRFVVPAFLIALFAAALVLTSPSVLMAQQQPQPTPGQPQFPPFDQVIQGYEQVQSSADGQSPLMTMWLRRSDNQLLLEIPSGAESKRYFIALTVASGERFAGLQAGDTYIYFRRYPDRVALIEPNLDTRSTGDQESRQSVRRLFTDRVLVDVPVATERSRGTAIIDLDELLLGRADRFFGMSAMGMNRGLSRVVKAKAFPENLEIAFEVPVGDGRLKTLHYSISVIPEDTGYKPRKADARVGYFTTSFRDLGKYDDDLVWVRYINRWNLKKADPGLKVSPPAEPLVFYIEHTTPIRYRRFVRDGIQYWNKAYEKIGIVNAIEVRDQDARTGAHMDKDPEDVRYNFVRWLNNDVAVAIGPSRVHPMTGQILDADIIFSDGWLRSYAFDFNKVLPRMAMRELDPDSLAWLRANPHWDPRFLFASPAERELLLEKLAKEGPQALGGHSIAKLDPSMIGDDEWDGLVDRVSQVNGYCMAPQEKAFDLALLRMNWALKKGEGDEGGSGGGEGAEGGDKPKAPATPAADVLDGMPAEFIGPLLADVVAHEVGHTLGLRHNFKASGLYSLAEINSDALKGRKPFSGSVMDYIPINMVLPEKEGEVVQGDYAMIGVGPYDEWAIEYGYTQQDDLAPILARCTEPGHQYATDEDSSGPDPTAKTFDFSANPLDYATNQVRLAAFHRERLLTDFVAKGDSWAKARSGYELTLGLQFRAIHMMSQWVGSAYVRRDKKGDVVAGTTEGRAPIEVVDADKQRAALAFVIEHSFKDQAYGITPELLAHMTVEKWLDFGGWMEAMEDSAYPLHDRIMAVQASVLSMLMSPSRLRRLYDNEARVSGDVDVLTLPELLETINTSVWTELKDLPDAAASFTDRKPWISSLRRNLQREHIDRLIDLAFTNSGGPVAYRPIASLALLNLRQLEERIGETLTFRGASIDRYSRAHLVDMKRRVNAAVEASAVINAKELGR